MADPPPKAQKSKQSDEAPADAEPPMNVSHLPEKGTSGGATDEVLKSRRQLAQCLRAAQLSKTVPDLRVQHKFWDTQPVPKLAEVVEDKDCGPVDEKRTTADVRQEPLSLPAAFEWATCDLKDIDVLHEVYALLKDHYVEDDDNMFRFDYPAEFLEWALLIPGYHKDWHIGVRAKESKKLFAFITGTPVVIHVNGSRISAAEINFLCVHKKLRTKRLAPVLIKEVTRRVNTLDVWQGVYTAGTLLPSPVAECRYYHRAINIKKLTEVRFSALGERLTMSRAIRLYKLPETTQIPGLRALALSDMPQVVELLKDHLSKYKFAPVFSLEEATHLLMPRKNVIYSYVREFDGKVTDLVSFYSLPSSVIGNEKHSTLHAAYTFYITATSVKLEELMSDALVLAKKNNFDVFNALDIGENLSFLKALKFGPGDGSLRYYLYNWKTPQMQSSDVQMLLV